jgi:hypothetical protein
LNASEIIHLTEDVTDPVSFLKGIDEANIDYRWFEDGSLLVTVAVFQRINDMVPEGIINTTVPAVGLA